MRLRTAAVTVLTLGLLYWFLQNANLSEVWQHVRRARMDLLLLSFLFVLATYWARAIRWQCLLAPIGRTHFRTVFRTTVLGFAALALLPARVGDVIRPYLLARQEGLAISATFATVVMERVLDLIAVLALLAIYVWGFSGAGALPAAFLKPVELSAGIAAAVAVVLVALMWILATHPERIGTLAGVAARVLPGRISGRIEKIVAVFSGGFAAAREPRALALALLWSFAVWLAIAAEAWAVTIAFGIAMPFEGTFLLQALLVIGVAVPTPGGVGSYHAAYRWGVTNFFGAANDQAVAGAIVTHAISFVPVVLLGLVIMAQDGLSVGRLKDLAGAAREDEEGGGPDGSGHHREGQSTDEVPVLRPSRR
jgi:glycosyltransferase 2 family protein